MGVGDRIEQIVEQFTGQIPSLGCGCDEYLQQMNEWGPDGCRIHLAEILQRFRVEGRTKKWWAKLQRAVPGKKSVYREVLILAIHDAEIT
jgi:hypothetical protein